MGVFGTIIIGAAGTAIGTYFQNKTAENKRKLALRERELKVANGIFEEVSKRMDLLLYSMWQTYESFSYKLEPDVQEKRWLDCIQVFKDWDSSINLEFARIKGYYGENMYRFFKEKIWRRFLVMDKQLKLLFVPLQKGQKSTMENLDVEENGETLFMVTGRLIRPALEAFNSSMIKYIQHEQVGILRKNNQ